MSMRPRTPMLQQYFAAKDAHPGVLIAMRVGDFYEFYGEDAERAAALLEITLTGREDGEHGRIPMAGVPYHSVEKYLARLVAKGEKVALCDQVEDPKKAKGLVRREVTRVITPGTVLEESMLAGSQSNFLAATVSRSGVTSLAFLDPSTGEFFASEWGPEEGDLLGQELARVRPAELLLEPDQPELSATIQAALGLPITEREMRSAHSADAELRRHFQVATLEGFGLEPDSLAVVAAAAVLDYVRANGLALEHITTLTSYSTRGFVAIDPATRAALELTSNMNDGSRKFTLLSVIDGTVTPMGSRLLRRWVEEPLLDPGAIEARLNAVDALVKRLLPREDLRDRLRKVMDIERLVGRCASRLATPRDLEGLKNSLRMLPEVIAALEPFEEMSIRAQMQARIEPLPELSDTLARAIVDGPPLTLRDGGVIAAGYNAELDETRALAKDGRSLIAQLEQREREATGIHNLKVGFNNVFGYYVEVSKVHERSVPDRYIRKQTTANAERYITAELKELESSVLTAGERAATMEIALFEALRDQVALHAASLLRSARAVAELDVLAGLASIAVQRNYRRPKLVTEDVLLVQSGRHPTVEANRSQYVPNDVSFDDTSRLMVLTGPNMSGKSTYLRQAALIVILAQIGSFVPAKSCEMGLCDRIFARIGAKDEIALGQSTFMVEMVESAYILNHATDRSLVVLDEVGRGTSTYDGLAIAWAMLEHLHEIGCKTLFATHYHQLNVLADQLPRVKNYRVSVKEDGEDLVWTHRVVPGGTDRSYGIHVARKAGVPPSVLVRAKSILAQLESRAEFSTPDIQKKQMQLTLFEAEDSWLLQELRETSVDELSPLQALNLLNEWRTKMDS